MKILRPGTTIGAGIIGGLVSSTLSPGGGGPSGPLASDSFNRANGALGTTDGNGHTGAAGGSGLTWTTQSGTVDISSNEAQLNGIATVPCGQADVRVSAAIDRSTLQGGVVGRWTDEDNYVYAYVITSNCLLREVDNFGITLLNVPVTVVDGHIIEIRFSGTTATLFYNNVNLGSATLKAQTNGTAHGLYGNSASNTADNFVVWSN